MFRIVLRIVTLSLLLAIGVAALVACQANLPPQPQLATQTAEAPVSSPAQQPEPESPAVPPDGADEKDLDFQLRHVISELELSGDPSIGRNLPSIESPIAQLGKKLFFTKALGGDMDSACVTCHSPLLGGGDALRLSIGVGALEPDQLGKGRTHPEGYATVPRNAPTTFNIGMWDSVLFHDGRAESFGKTLGANGADGLGIRTPDVPFGEIDPAAGDNLVMAQSRFPITSKEEMRGFGFEAGKPNQAVRNHLAARLGDYGPGNAELEICRWVAEFRQAFNSTAPVDEIITEHNIFKAIGEYERSQVFVDTPWRAYVLGDASAIDDSATRGALLFFRDVENSGADCASCHKGDFFTDEMFHVLAIPQIGKGKGDGPTQDDDLGRFRETKDPADLYAFRTPTLLNVEVTGPYGHDGAYLTLEGIVRHHLDPEAAVANYDFFQLEPDIYSEHAVMNTQRALGQLLANREAGLPAIENVSLSDQEVDDILSFLLTLTDPCVKDPACLAPWIPQTSESDPDLLRIEVAANR